MKQTAFAAVIAFWSVIGTLLAVHTLTPPPVSAAGEKPRVITPEELARHDTTDDCWMAIEGKVYDFTDYIPDHPTPPDVMAPWCGKDATEGMRTKGYGRDHSPAAWAMLDAYLIGELAQ